MTEKTFREHPDLEPGEKEVHIRYNKAGDVLHIHSDIPSISRWLLDHPAFDVGATEQVSGDIIEVRGTLPVQYLSLKGKPRQDTSIGAVRGSLPDP